jgi:DNA-binding NtrC family response regulator
MDEITILALDDQPETLDVIREALAAPGRRILTFSQPQLALQAFEDRRVDILLTDLQMPGLNGLEVLAAVKARSPETEVVMMTAYGDVELAVQAMKQGAADFFTKPLRVTELAAVVGRLSEFQLMRQRLKDLSGDDVAPVGTGEGMQHVLSLGRSVADTDTTVLLLGETGTGKEVLANYIQRHSSRKSGPFVKVNCAAFPESLLESELFGHEKGAFTGAADRHTGRFERANKGTLFLDEIAEMPHSVQVKLLRVLQSREVERLGGTQPVPVNFRLICATHRNLERFVAEGKFREDLYYRINVFPVHVLPLRERVSDIAPLAYHFLRRARGKLGRGPAEIHQSAVSKLCAHSWPGNVRELENVIERASVLCRGSMLMTEQIMLQPACRTLAAVAQPALAASPVAAPVPVGAGVDAGSGEGSHSFEESYAHESGNGNGHGNGQSHGNGNGNGNGHNPGGGMDHILGDLECDSPLDAAEKHALRHVLERCDWNFKRAADVLKLSRSTLYAKVSKYGIKK